MTIQSNNYNKAVKEALVEKTEHACDVIQEKINQLKTSIHYDNFRVRPQHILELLEDLNKIVKNSTKNNHI